ncbi:hypothetical protein thsps21_30720 [Pseudomonas sp. No.21]|nr:hypothetical protein TUM20249_50290 [Pseudomonas tohonis]
MGVVLHSTRQIDQAAMSADRQIDSQKITVISPDKLWIELPAARAGKFDEMPVDLAKLIEQRKCHLCLFSR